MDAVVVRRFDKQSKVLMPDAASVVNRSTTPPKVQFVPAHINIWAPQAQQQLLQQQGSKGSRPQSAHGSVYKGLPITAVSLQTAMNIKQREKALSTNSSRPSSAPVMTFSRADTGSANADDSLPSGISGPKVRSVPTSEAAVISEVMKGLGPQLAQTKLELAPRPAHSTVQRPITADFRKLHLTSVAQYSQKRPMSSHIPDRSSKSFSSSSQQQDAEIETFDSGGDSDTDTFAHTKLTSASTALSRPSSSSSKHRDHPKSQRPNFGYAFVLLNCVCAAAHILAACRRPPAITPNSGNRKYLNDFPKHS